MIRRALKILGYTILLCIFGILFVTLSPTLGWYWWEKVPTPISSPHFESGVFTNRYPKAALTQRATQGSVFKKFLFPENAHIRPTQPLPSEKIDLSQLDKKGTHIVWLGHSGYLIQAQEIRYLVDPQLSTYAAPLPFMFRAFEGSTPYSPEDIPEIDYLLITHDHYDHLDYATMTALKGKVRRVITGLGTGSHLIRWGFDPSRITEKDWGDSVEIQEGTTVTLSTTQHFSGRTWKRNTTLWTSFILKTPHFSFYLGGDGGYGQHYKEAGDVHGPFDLAVLECGQYNENWKYMHQTPEEAVQAAIDLRAKAVLPVHWGKFVLSTHDWDEPIKRITQEAELRSISLLTPKIGSLIDLENTRTQERWWENVK